MKRPWTQGEKWLFAAPLLFGIVALGVAIGPRVVQRITGYPTQLLPTAGSQFRSLALSRDGRILVAGEIIGDPKKATTNTIQFWDARTLEPLLSLQRPLSPQFYPRLKRTFYDRQTLAVAVSPNSKILAWHSPPRGATFTDISTRRPLWSVETYNEGVSFSPDSRLVALMRYGTGDDNFIQIATAATGKPVTRWDAGAWPEKDFEFSPQGRYFASASPKPPYKEWTKAPDKSGGDIEVRRVRDWKIERVLPLPNTQEIAFSPDDKSLVGIGPIYETSYKGSASKTRMRCFDPSTGQIRWEIDPNKRLPDARLRMVQEACYSPDGKLIATVTGGRNVILLNAETGAIVRALPPKLPRGPVFVSLWDLAFSPNGKRLFARGADAVLVWELN